MKYEKELWNLMVLFPNGAEFRPCLPISSFIIAKFLDFFYFSALGIVKAWGHLQ